MVEMNIKTHFDLTNLVLEKSVPRGNTVIIQGGESASAMEEGGSEPDRASFRFPKNEDGTTYTQCLAKLGREGSSSIQNIIPGEIKVYEKFSRQLLYALWLELTAKGRKNPKAFTPNYGARLEAEKVFTQIYQYMNERNAAVSYIMTDQELICIRRIDQERYGSKYGVIDISPSIPLSTERGNFNAKFALWYLHHKYGIREPHLNYFETTPKPDNWRLLIRAIHQTRQGLPPRVPDLANKLHHPGTVPLALRKTPKNVRGNRFDPLSSSGMTRKKEVKRPAIWDQAD
jgi:hypothetical protein